MAVVGATRFGLDEVAEALAFADDAGWSALDQDTRDHYRQLAEAAVEAFEAMPDESEPGDYRDEEREGYEQACDDIAERLTKMKVGQALTNQRLLDRVIAGVEKLRDRGPQA